MLAVRMVVLRSCWHFGYLASFAVVLVAAVAFVVAVAAVVVVEGRQQLVLKPLKLSHTTTLGIGRYCGTRSSLLHYGENTMQTFLSLSQLHTSRILGT